MEYLKYIKKLFLSAFSRLKEKVTNAYLILTGRHKIIGDIVVDTTTGEIIGHNSLSAIGDAISNSVTNVLLGRMYFTEKPESLKGKIIRAVSVLGIDTIFAAGIIFIKGAKFSFLLLLEEVVLLYLVGLIIEIASRLYEISKTDRYSYSVEPLDGQVLSVYEDNVIASEGTLAPEETPVSDVSCNRELVANHDEDVLAPQEKLEISLLALAIFVAKYSSKGSIVTSNVMYCAFVCDPNTLPQGYKMKLKDFYLKHYDELVAISISIEGEQLIPIQQYRSFCKERMFTKDSSYSKAKYSNEFYEMVKNQK